MNAKQRSTYFGTLWPAACKAQGWNAKDEDRRKDVTFAATGVESTSKLNEDQITLLFNKLKWLAEPGNFDLAYADANPEIALAENKRAQLIWRIEHTAAKKGFNEAWLATAAEHKCVRHCVKEWRHLPSLELVKFSMTVAKRQPGTKAPAPDESAGAEEAMPF